MSVSSRNGTDWSRYDQCSWVNLLNIQSIGVTRGQDTAKLKGGKLGAPFRILLSA